MTLSSGWRINRDGHCDLPKGTIEKIIGRMLPDDECFWLNQEEQIDKAIEHYENYTKDEY